MSALKDVAEAPAEVKLVLSHLKPEPEALAHQREDLLAQLEEGIASSRGSLQGLLTRLRAVLLSRRPGTEFRPRVASEFAQALLQYKRSADADELPPIVGQCFLYLREHVAATGLGPLLAAVNPAPARRESHPAWLARQQQRLQMTLKLGSIRE